MLENLVVFACGEKDVSMTFINQFTEREREVIDLLLQGKSNKQIALQLDISKSTVEFHLKNVYFKLGVNSRTEAILHLSKNSLLESTGNQSEGELRQSIGDNFSQTEYSSQAKHFFDPKEERIMENRTLISIILSLVAILISLGAFVVFRNSKLENQATALVEKTPDAQPTMSVNTSQERSLGILNVPADASTRFYDEVLLLLRTPDVPFHYAAVFASIGCFIPDEQKPCAFTGPIPYSEPPEGFVYWRPDGEYGFFTNGNEIFVMDHLERVNPESDVLVPEILTTQSIIHLSPDGRWMVESVQNNDPYASDLVLIKSTSGRIDKLDIGLEECFKVPLGWLTPTQFLFRCEVFTGATSKKLLSEVRYYTYDVLSDELVEFSSGMKVGFGPISPNGRYIVRSEKEHEDLSPGNIQIQDLSNNRIYPLSFRDGQIAWSHDSNQMAIFRDSGDIYVSNYDGSNQRKIYSSGWQGYLAMEWFPDDKYIALVGQPSDDPQALPQMIILSVNGNVINYDSVPTTDGYVIVDVSPLPAIRK